MAGFFVNYAASVRMPQKASQYQLVEAIPMIPMGFAFIGTLFLKDTPRWLASQGRMEEASQSLARLLNTEAPPEKLLETSEVLALNNTADRQLKGVSIWQVIKETFTVRSYRKRFFLSIFIQTVAQWSGGNGITYYITNVRPSSSPFPVLPIHPL